MISLSDDLVLNYHIMHPGGASEPADPNGAFFYKNKYHLHYIGRHLQKNNKYRSCIQRLSEQHLWVFQ